MAPHRNHVEARSSRKPARQFVSETHDHKPDAHSADAPPNFFTGTKFSVDQLAIDHEALRASLKSLRLAHEQQDAIGMKLAAEGAAKLLGQMQALSAHLAGTAVTHINRRPR